MSKKILVVGGVAGGASTVTRLRRLDEMAEIILFEKDEFISFANCGLPYYIGGSIQSREELLIQTPEAMKQRFNIDVRVFSEVMSIDPERKVIKVNSKQNGEYEESYDYIVLSPGAKALKPRIPGIHSDRILTLRNIADTDKIKSAVNHLDLNHVVVVGGGFIGVEMAENLRNMGFAVSLVEAAPHILAPFDDDMVTIAEKKMRDKGVRVILNDPVKAFEKKHEQVEITLNSGMRLISDLVILAMGVKPDTEFLMDSGIKLGQKGHIIVNEYLETSLDHVYAVGDAIEVMDYTTKEKVAIPLAGPANKQGRIVAGNIVADYNNEDKKKYKGSQGTSILKIFDLTAASTGANERTLKRIGLEYKSVITHPFSHASYYPGGLPMTIKLIFDLEGKILGAQAMGYDGVDKRIDVIATAIRFNGTVEDLTELDLSYAPPYSSAKDPVNMVGYVAENIVKEKVDVIHWNELSTLNKNSYTILDVRTLFENMYGEIPGAMNIELDQLRNRFNELDKDKLIAVYCEVGLRGYLACRILNQNGFKTKNITGGFLLHNYLEENEMELKAASVNRP